MTFRNTRQKVLLLNLPSKLSILKDYYCNNISKSNYLHYPMDLLFLSGTLDENNFEVKVIDALAKKYSTEETITKIKDFKPDFMVGLVGSLSWEEDKEFLSRLKKTMPNLKIIGTGDIFLDDGITIIKENSFFDGCIKDFSDKSILNLINKLNNGTNSSEAIENCIYKGNGSGPIGGKTVRSKGEFSLPMPKHEYFPLKEYRYAFSRRFPTAHLMTDFGCAFNCSFCPIRNDNLGFKVRSVDEVIKELKYIKSLGVKELYFRDQTFGSNKKRAIELCDRMLEEGLKFSWHCFSRVDVVNEELLDVMKKSGCHTIIFGIESANDKTLQDVQKRITTEKIKNAFTLCKKHKIRRAATFIIGIPGETEEDIIKTVDFAIDIDCTFASFNLADIRPGTDWSHHREQVKFLPYDELVRIRNKAIKKFYLRPLYLAKRITEISSTYDLNVLLEEGMGLIFNMLSSVIKPPPRIVKDTH